MRVKQAKKFEKAISRQHNDKCLQIGITWTDATLALPLCLVLKFIFQTCETKVGSGRKRRKTLRSSKSAAPSINNLKRCSLSGISLQIKIIHKKKQKCIYNRNEVTYTQNYRNVCTKEAELHKYNYN